jgi:hypothetical protein
MLLGSRENFLAAGTLYTMRFQVPRVFKLHFCMVLRLAVFSGFLLLSFASTPALCSTITHLVVGVFLVLTFAI